MCKSDNNLFLPPWGLAWVGGSMCKSDTASKYSSAQFAAAQRWARVWVSMCKSDSILEGEINGVNWGNSGMMGAGGR